MRVATLVRRLLRLGRDRGVGVELIEGEHEQVVGDIAGPERRRMRCSGYGPAERSTIARSAGRARAPAGGASADRHRLAGHPGARAVLNLEPGVFDPRPAWPCGSRTRA
jgi:hypothetical protein